MASPLSADAILSQFEQLIDDSLDITTELFLLNEVKDTLETQRSWAMLMGLDTSQSTSTGDTFNTTHALPSDFAMPSPRGIYVTGDLIPYRQIPFEGQIDFQAITYAYFIDYYNSQYHLCGSPGRTAAIQFFYRRFSPTLTLITSGGSPWIFPARFHPILPYLMAKKYFAIDQGENRNWDDKWDIYIRELKEAMVSWDDSLQTLALQNESETMVRDLSGYPTIIDMDLGGSPGASMVG